MSDRETVDSQHYEKHKLPFVRTEYGVQYVDVNRVVRLDSREAAERAARAYPHALVVSRSVGEWIAV
jgi:hypothetical protein